MLSNKEQGSILPTVFSFNEHSPVRTILIEDQPWFTAIDVCDILGVKNARDRVVNSLDADEGSRDKSGGKLWRIKIILISLHKKRDARE